jgi:8-oxo-dGTP pyrophosphatase MutT (NUDIX family)
MATTSPLSRVIEPGLTTYPYLERELRENDSRGYRAAGVLAFSEREGRRYVFMGSELRQNSAEPQLTFLAGKREQSDRDAEYTAAREFWEESGRLLNLPELYTALRNAPDRKVLWISSGKMALFLLNAKDLVPDILPELYHKLENRPAFSEMSNLHWISTADLLSSVQPVVNDIPIYSFAFSVLKLGPFISWLQDNSLEAKLNALTLQ